MKKRSTRHATTMLAAALVAAALLAGSDGPRAYTVVTRDGHIIQTKARPEIRGLEAFMRLAPQGLLAVIQEERIDWALTDAANPEPRYITVPADSKLTEGASPKTPSRPIEMKIVGNPPSKEQPAAPIAGQTDPQKAPGEGSQDQKTINAKEALIKLQKEFASVAAARDTADTQKKSLESELSELQSRESGYASDENSGARRIRELQQQISDLNDQINKCETRLNDIRNEAVQLGGSID